MNLESKDPSGGIKLELNDEEKGHIRTVFFEDIAPKLKKLHARIGAISCEFAGNQYRKWTIQFDSRGSDFEILGFEYDEDAGSLDLDL
jgi:hypothetical protein